MKIVFAGGGSGGHIIPIIAIVRELKKYEQTIAKQTKKGVVYDTLEYVFMGPKGDLDYLLVEEGIKVVNISSGKFRRTGSVFDIFNNFIDIIFRIPLGLIQAYFWILFNLFSVKLIFCKGGYGAVPASFAGWLLYKKVYLHESDSIPGAANRLIGTFADKIYISFAQKKLWFPPQKTTLVGNPVRESLLLGSKGAAGQMFSLSFEKPIILIIGGSQGSQRFNDMVLNVLDQILFEFEVIHQCGTANIKQYLQMCERLMPENLCKYYHLAGFLDDTQYANALAAADVIISRAGSGSIFEIAKVGKPSILIPLPESAQNHQSMNAFIYSRFGAATIMEEGNFTPNLFLEQIRVITSDAAKREQMSKAAQEFAKINAGQIIASDIYSLFS